MLLVYFAVLTDSTSFTFCTLFAVNTTAFLASIWATILPTVSETSYDLRAISSTRTTWHFPHAVLPFRFFIERRKCSYCIRVGKCTLRCFFMFFWQSVHNVCAHVLLCIWACTWRIYLHRKWRSSCVDNRFYHCVFIVGCCAASNNLNAINIFGHHTFLFKSVYLLFDPSFHDSSNSFWRGISLRCGVNVIGNFETSVLQWVRWQRVV